MEGELSVVMREDHAKLGRPSARRFFPRVRREAIGGTGTEVDGMGSGDRLSGFESHLCHS